MNDPEYPKSKAASLAKKFAYDYWDGDRRICMVVINILKDVGRKLHVQFVLTIHFPRSQDP